MAKTDYKKVVLDYLLEHKNEEIKRDVLIKSTGISKSRLSEILKSIREDGYNVSTPPRSGLIVLEQISNQVILPAIKDVNLREWLIIFLLSRYGSLSFRELVLKELNVKEYDLDVELKLDNKDVYDDSSLIKAIKSEYQDAYQDQSDINIASDFLSITTLRKDLTHLREEGLIRLSHSSNAKYELTSKAPYILSISEDSLIEFCQKYEDHLSTTSELLPIKHVYKKVQQLIEWDGFTYEQRKFGKINEITNAQIDKFNEFVSHPYKTNALILHSNFKNVKHEELTSVGILFYSVETSAFYILGLNHSTNHYEVKRLDYIDSISDTELANTVFHSDECYQMFDEMFAAGFDPQVYHVKVLLRDFGNVTTRFKSLNSIRKESTLHLIDSPPSDCLYKYVYEDNIRGLSDFARFLRSFGYSVLALEPMELKQQMIGTYNRIIEKYESMEQLINE